MAAPADQRRPVLEDGVLIIPETIHGSHNRLLGSADAELRSASARTMLAARELLMGRSLDQVGRRNNPDRTARGGCRPSTTRTCRLPRVTEQSAPFIMVCVYALLSSATEVTWASAHVSNMSGLAALMFLSFMVVTDSCSRSDFQDLVHEADIRVSWYDLTLPAGNNIYGLLAHPVIASLPVMMVTLRTIISRALSNSSVSIQMVNARFDDTSAFSSVVSSILTMFAEDVGTLTLRLSVMPVIALSILPLVGMKGTEPSTYTFARIYTDRRVVAFLGKVGLTGLFGPAEPFVPVISLFLVLNHVFETKPGLRYKYRLLLSITANSVDERTHKVIMLALAYLSTIRITSFISLLKVTSLSGSMDMLRTYEPLECQRFERAVASMRSSSLDDRLYSFFDGAEVANDLVTANFPKSAGSAGQLRRMLESSFSKYVVSKENTELTAALKAMRVRQKKVQVAASAVHARLKVIQSITNSLGVESDLSASAVRDALDAALADGSTGGAQW